MISDYLTITVQVRRADRTDQYGAPTGAGETLDMPTIFRASSRIVRTPQGEQVVASGVFVFDAGTAVNYGDRIVLKGIEYRPVFISRPQSLDGEESVRVFVA